MKHLSQRARSSDTENTELNPVFFSVTSVFLMARLCDKMASRTILEIITSFAGRNAVAADHAQAHLGRGPSR